MKSEFVKKVSLWILLFILGASASYLYLKPKDINLASITPRKLGPVSAADADPNLDTYRASGAYASLSIYPSAKVFGILHDTLSVKEFTNKILYDFMATHTPKPGYAWQIGIYPMVCKMTFDGKERPRIGIYLIPTMAKENVSNPTPGQIIDYVTARDGADYIYYIKDSMRPIELAKPTRILAELFIYDEGHLWP